MTSIAEIAERHQMARSSLGTFEYCRFCQKQNWPCDAIRCLDAMEDMERLARELAEALRLPVRYITEALLARPEVQALL